MHDLEIRGAGEVLGEDQSGQMQEVGFSLYTEMLERAVRCAQARASCPTWTRAQRARRRGRTARARR